MMRVPSICTKRLPRLLLLSLLSIVMLAYPAADLAKSYAQASQTLGVSNEPIRAQTMVPGGNQRVNIEVTDESVRRVLHDLSMEGGFNLVLDNSVEGTITLEMSDVTVNDALAAISAAAGIEIIEKGSDIYLAMSREAAAKKGLNRQLSKIVKIRYANSQRIAQLLSASIFATNQGKDGQASVSNQRMQPVQNDARTNSIVLVGTAAEIQLAEEAIKRLDIPRERRTFYLSHANAVDVAAQLSSSIFNDGTMGGLMLGNNQSGGGGGMSGGSMGGGSSGVGSMASGSSGGSSGTGITVPMGQPSSLRVEQEEVEEGEGVNDFGSSGGSGESSSSVSNSIRLRGIVKSTELVNVSPEGPIVVPDTRTNAVTVMGTAQQIALAENLIPILDARPPQVAIEAALVEVSETGVRQLSNGMGLALNKVKIGFNNGAISTNLGDDGISGLTGMPTIGTNGEALSGATYNTNSATTNDDFVTQIRALVTSNRAKILANPSIVAVHDTEAIISIVDEIVRRVTVETEGINGFTTNTVELGDAGIVLNILPKIGADNTITMRIRPSVTTVSNTTTDSRGNTITLLSKRDFLGQQVRLQDGQTIALGGLVRESSTNLQEKFPGLGDLPIVGALFRASSRSNSRTELVLMITPHILDQTRVTPVSYTDSPVSGNFATPASPYASHGGLR